MRARTVTGDIEIPTVSLRAPVRRWPLRRLVMVAGYILLAALAGLVFSAQEHVRTGTCAAPR